MRRRESRSLRLPVLHFVGFTSLLLVVQHVSAHVLRDDGYTFLPWKGLRYYLDGWSQFDGPEYQRIAELGYSYTPGVRSNIVWFPLYPNLMRLVHPLVGDWLVTGIVVSAVAGAAALCVYWRWLEDRGIVGPAQVVAFFVLALYPYGWYLYGVVHSDSLFLLLLVGAFLLVERDRYLLAGLVAAMATATRPTGLALIPAIVLLGLQRHGVLSADPDATGWRARVALPSRIDLSRLRPITLAPALVVVGIGWWMAYLWVRFDDPIAFATNQRVYHPSALPLLKRTFVTRWINVADDPTFAITITGQALVALLVVLSVPAVCRRFGFAYGLFLAVLVAIPTVSTADFMGTGRYLLAAFPAYALWGERLAERPPLARAWIIGFGSLVVVLAFLFARSAYLT